MSELRHKNSRLNLSRRFHEPRKPLGVSHDPTPRSDWFQFALCMTGAGPKEGSRAARRTSITVRAGKQYHAEDRYGTGTSETWKQMNGIPISGCPQAPKMSSTTAEDLLVSTEKFPWPGSNCPPSRRPAPGTSRGPYAAGSAQQRSPPQTVPCSPPPTGRACGSADRA